MLEPIRKNGVLDVPTALERGRVHRIRVDGTDISWLITNKNDEIQREQIRRGFYELDELRQLLGDVGQQATIMDIGSNIGNHAVYFAKRFGCRRLMLVEPYPPAIRHLLVNTALNFDSCLDFSLLGYGIGREQSSANLITPSRFNIGLTKLSVAERGDIPLVTVDAAVGQTLVNLVKVDVEGMELDVLAGMAGVLSDQRPILYIEVEDENRSNFEAELARHRYKILRETRAYRTQGNFTCVPL